MSSVWSYLLILLVPLPIGTDRRRRHVPWVTLTLIALNVAVFIVSQVYLKAHPGEDIFSEYGFLPARPSLKSLFVSMFLHVNFGHLFWNMAFLWLFGPHVEDALGSLAFLALYIGGGVVAGVLHTAIKWLILSQRVTLGEPLVGASGAISAIVAPFAVRYHRAQIRLLWLPGLLARNDWGHLEVPALAGLSLWLLQNAVGAVLALRPNSGGVAYWAHLGGFAWGLVASEVGGLLREGRQEYLLQEARASAAQGHDLRRVAVPKYRAFLDHDPNNLAVHVELARALAQQVDDPEAGRQEAAVELLSAMRACGKRHRWSDAVGLYAEARSLGLSLPLTPRERLRLAAAAEEAGGVDAAVSLLRAVIAETPDAPEDEMARLKVGQLLLKSEPDEARAVLASFLEKYPHSPWTARVRDLLRPAETDKATPEEP